MGIYFLKHWLLKFMCEYEQGENAIEFTKFGSEFDIFVEKNQFTVSTLQMQSEELAAEFA